MVIQVRILGVRPYPWWRNTLTKLRTEVPVPVRSVRLRTTIESETYRQRGGSQQEKCPYDDRTHDVHVDRMLILVLVWLAFIGECRDREKNRTLTMASN